jgi:hypothetical protein
MVVVSLFPKEYFKKAGAAPDSGNREENKQETNSDED